MIKKVALFIGLLITTNLFAQALPTIKLNTPYGNVRAQLIKSGWTPVKQREPCIGTFCNIQRNNGYYETLHCWDMSTAACNFVFANSQGKEIIVVTNFERLLFNGFRLP